MISKKVLRYYSDCGRGFWKKKKAIYHDTVCKCWSNPKNKTCKTCKHNESGIDSNGMEHEPQYLDTWHYNECKLGVYETDDWNQTNDKLDININCVKWETI